MSVRHLFGREDTYTYGRCDAKPGEPRWKAGGRWLHTKRTTSKVEWVLLRRPGHGVGFRFGRNGSESDAGLDLYLGPIASVWLRISSPWTKWLKVRDRESPGWYHPRHTGIWFHSYRGNIVRVEWDSASDGGKALRREWALNTRQIVGHKNVDRQEIDSGVCRVPLPEGVYDASYKTEQMTWSYARYPGKLKDWFGKSSHVSTKIEIPGGIPIEGKGENSWDCGMDGIFSQSGPGRIEAAVGALVASVQRQRNQYGGPHNLPRPMTVAEAEAS